MTNLKTAWIIVLYIKSWWNSHNYGNYKFQYINGALERTKKCNPAEAIILESQGIREHVCDILEGGKVAFEKREQKYGFGKYANSNN